jgi:hypothetical protein
MPVLARKRANISETSFFKAAVAQLPHAERDIAPMAQPAASCQWQPGACRMKDFTNSCVMSKRINQDKTYLKF